ncbi:unnamed protein product [Clonostachys rhizophaga]|uniref:F-box domain-containing protein n=1 Tax=Clonostachys rhizophaga TaxID=160324 RepID=A0A9N9VHX3_9HYPO|nr:unnamed protein product [Clonostachys rhizophaga]
MSSPLPLLPAPANDIISTMPGEVVGIILDHIPELKTLAKLNAASRRWRSYTTSRLYRTVSVQVLGPNDWGEFQLLLRPHIHNLGFQSLGTDYRHTWQRAFKIPGGAFHVQRLFVSGIAKFEDPQRIRLAIRWLGQALGNMHSLEGLHCDLLTDQMVTQIFRLDKLKEVGLWNDEKPDSLQDLRHLRDLTYLSLGGDMACGDHTIPMMILRSAKTLKRLQLQPFFEGLWEYSWRRMVRELSSREDQLPFLSALKELTLSAVEFHPDLLSVLPKMVDFASLDELSIKHLDGSQRPFLDVVVRSLRSPIRPSLGVQLRSLCLGWLGFAMTTDGPNVMSTTDMTRLIACFDTLTRLEVQNYNQFANPPGYNMLKFYPALIEAVIQHKNLKVLKFTHTEWEPSLREIAREVKFPKLSESEVKIFIDNLQGLEEFHFAPDVKRAWRVGATLAAAPNLRYVGCDGFELWMKWEPEWSPRSDPYILLGLAHAVFKKHEKSSNDGDQVPFTWEDHTKICSMTIDGIRIHIASSPRRDFLPVPWEVIRRRKAYQVQYLKKAPAIKPKSEPIFRQDMSGLQIQDC